MIWRSNNDIWLFVSTAVQRYRGQSSMNMSRLIFDGVLVCVNLPANVAEVHGWLVVVTVMAASI